MRNLTPKYLFVCYNTGGGGERLAQRLSQLDKCYTLNFRMWGDKTVCYDHLDIYQHLEYGKPLESTSLTEKYHVIPTHCRPEDVKYDGLKVTINFPKDPLLIEELKDNCYRKFWCYDGDNFKDKMREYNTRYGKITQEVYEMLKDPSCTWGHMVEKSKGLTWDQWWDEHIIADIFEYETADDILAIEYIMPQPIEIIEQINRMI